MIVVKVPVADPSAILAWIELPSDPVKMPVSVIPTVAAVPVESVMVSVGPAVRSPPLLSVTVSVAEPPTVSVRTVDEPFGSF